MCLTLVAQSKRGRSESVGLIVVGRNNHADMGLGVIFGFVPATQYQHLDPSHSAQYAAEPLLRPYMGYAVSLFVKLLSVISLFIDQYRIVICPLYIEIHRIIFNTIWQICFVYDGKYAASGGGGFPVTGSCDIYAYARCIISTTVG